MDFIMKLKILLGALMMCSSSAFAFSFGSLTGDDLPSLTSSRTEGLGIAKISVPYANSVNYFGYIDKNSKPSAKIKGKDAYYLYVWVPAALDELGVRMISPVGDLAEPSKGDFVQKGFEKKLKKDADKWFDTWIRVERIHSGKNKKCKKSF